KGEKFIINLISKRITDSILTNISVLKNDQEVLQYSVTIMIEKIIVTFFVGIIVFFSKLYIEGLGLYLGLVYFRNKHDGIHFKNFSICMLFSVLLFTSGIILTTILSNSILNYTCMLISSVYCFEFYLEKRHSLFFTTIVVIVMSLLLLNFNYSLSIFNSVFLGMTFSLLLSKFPFINSLKQYMTTRD
ncbi:hypothetical protein B6N69_15120, partial [Listeria monocytogenes]|nr:hypothetical protein [Listeria monocytogenes]